MVGALDRTWVDPLHAIWVGIVVAHSETGIANYLWRKDGAVKACDGAVCVKVVAPPAGIRDDCMGRDDGGQEREEGCCSGE